MRTALRDSVSLLLSPEKGPAFAGLAAQARLPRCLTHNFERPTFIPQFRRQLVRCPHNCLADLRNSFFGHPERRSRNAHGRSQFSGMRTYGRADAPQSFLLLLVIDGVAPCPGSL